jgi:glutamate 5-kinase
VSGLKRIVVKLGTEQLNQPRIDAVCARVAELRSGGTEVFIVSSGAIGFGMKAIGLSTRPKELAKKQACAAIGQSLLMKSWQAGFAPHGLTVAQVLLTHDDLRVRARYLAVQETLRQLVAYGAVPVVNENDTVSAAEIQFGDNDTLAAMVASLVKADHLFIVSTAPGLIDLDGSGQIVRQVDAITPEIEAMAKGTKSKTAVGGMISKIAAAKIATNAGSSFTITDSISLDPSGPGTLFTAKKGALEAKKVWLAHFQRPTGTIRVDARAAAALRNEGRSLLAVGVTGAEGSFDANDVVDIADPDGKAIARGISALSCEEILALADKKGVEVVNRDNLALL